MICQILQIKVIDIDVYLHNTELFLYTYNYFIPIVPRLTGP